MSEKLRIEQDPCKCAWMVQGFSRVQIAWCGAHNDEQMSLPLPIAMEASQ